MEIIHEATNHTTYLWATTLTGAAMVDGLKKKEVDGMYAMAFKGNNGFHYLALTNRSDKYHQVTVNIGTQPLLTTFQRRYMWNATPVKNTPMFDDQVTGPAVEVPPYCVMLLQWQSHEKDVPTASRIYKAQIVQTGIALNWWKRENATFYEVICKNAAGKTLQTQKIPATAAEYTATKLKAGETYTFQVKALNANGQSPASEPVTLTFARPETPSIFKVAPRDTSITVFWHSVPQATGYRIVVQSQNHSFRTELEADNVFGFKVNGLAYDVPYTISVKSYNEIGESAFSQPVQVVCKRNIPLPPNNISAIKQANGSIQLQWNAPQNAPAGVQYRLLRGEKPHQFTQLADQITETSFTDQTASTGKSYFYTVKSYTSDGECNFYPNMATIIEAGKQFSVTVNSIERTQDSYEITASYANISADGQVDYGVLLSDVSYLNSEEERFITTQTDGKQFVVKIPLSSLKNGRTYSVKAFVQTNGGTPIISLPPYKEFKTE